MEIKVVKKVIRVVVGDDAYEVKKPTVGQAEKYSKLEPGVSNTLAMLDELGLPSAVSQELDLDTLQEIIAALMPQKKS